MTIPSLTDLVAQTDLNALVQRYTTAARVTGNQTLYHCPNPAHPDRHPSFSVITNRSGKQVARCFSQCAWHGDAIEFLKWIDNLSTAEAAKKLREFLGLSVSQTFSSATSTPSKRLLSVSPRPQDSTQRLTGEHSDRFLSAYLRSRGWPQSVAQTFGLEVVIDEKKEARIRHPYLVPHEHGTWVAGYWQDRGNKNAEPKWLSPRGSSPVLFNLKSLEVAHLEAVVICEGAPDTITASLALEGCTCVAVVGVPGVNAWQPSWAQLFNGLRIVIAADNDNAGRALEEAIRRDIDSAPAYLRPSAGDLTDTAKAIGLQSLRETLLDLLGTQPEAIERTTEEILALLFQHFPGGFIENDVA